MEAQSSKANVYHHIKIVSATAQSIAIYGNFSKQQAWIDNEERVYKYIKMSFHKKIKRRFFFFSAIINF